MTYFATDKEIEEFFGVPIIDIVKIDANTIYGYASSNSLNADWDCRVGSFLKLKGIFQTESQYWDIINSEFLNDEGFHNFAFFEVIEDDDEGFIPVSVFKQADVNEENSRLDQQFFEYVSEGKTYSKAFIISDLTRLINQDNRFDFKWLL